MKVKIEHRDSDLSEKDKKLFKEFMKLLQKKYPLKKNITIIFTGERYGKMTTGSRNDSSQIKVLTKNRINRDIMRTLSHEWVHEWQITTKKQKKGPHIGGKMEDEANAKSGAITKYFEKNNKDNEELIYEDLIKQNNIIKEEKQNVVKHIILEMKKIGIEKLPYSYSSLNKFIDSKTMDVHYNKHYKGYVKKLNKALSEKDYGDLELEEIIKSISRFSKKIRNNAGGAFNHALFWKMLSPKKQELKGNLLKKIKSEFGGYQQFKNKFEELAKNSFGSGWIWLTLTKNNRLKLITTPNQDNPLMNVIDGGGYPILGLDLWEHAYYLKYQSNRDKYISNFWNCVNWEFVGQLFDSKQKKEKINENTQMSNAPKPEACSRQEVEAYRLIFNINTQVKWAFRRKIDEVMERLFPDNWYDENEYTTGEMKGLYDFRGEKGRSVLNKLNTHYVCYCILVNDVNLVLRHIGEPIIEIIGKTPKEQIQQNERLINYIDRFAERIFSEESKTLKKMYPLLNKSNKFGEKGEEYAVKKLKQKFGEKNVDAVGRLGSTQDGKDGIDCVVNINGLVKTAQIKPYSKVEKKNDNYVFFDIGVAKRYSTDLLIFQRINGDVYVFKNEKVLMNQGAYYIHETSLIDMIS